jgi:hypothetical protein
MNRPALPHRQAGTTRPRPLDHSAPRRAFATDAAHGANTSQGCRVGTYPAQAAFHHQNNNPERNRC